MKVKLVAAAVLTAALALVAATAVGAGTQASSITVWLQTDAQASWPGVVAAANQAFEQKHPGVKVNVEYQTWGDHLTKLDAAIAGNNAPDVVELGNTETTKYLAAGALADLTSQRGSFANSSSWLPGLTKSCTYSGKLMCVPYYAGARAVIYRTDFYKKAGITRTPRSLDEFVSAHQKLMKLYGKDPNFSAFYFPGRFWYAGLSFVYDYGGKIAYTKGGKWVGGLSAPASVQGLTKLQQVTRALSRARRSANEFTPLQDTIFAQGKIGSIIGNGWEWGVILDKKLGNPALTGKLGAYPMPSHVAGKQMPTFLGGSNLGVAAQSKNKDLAADWIREFTSTASMTQLARVGKVIPNTTRLAGINASDPSLAPFAKAAADSWFVPVAPRWADVESAQVLQNLIQAIYSGKNVKEAARKADEQIEAILNSSA